MEKWKLAALLLAATLVACAEPGRSRNLGDPSVAAVVLAQQVCSNCHGITGISTSPNFPNLAAQPPAYLLAQLQAFKNHGREDPEGFEYMWGLSRSLSDAQMQGLADYFAAQAAPPPSPPPRRGDTRRGGEIYRAGLPEQSVAACAACHGEAGQGNAAFPRLAGQHADYVVRQLRVFKETDQRPAGAAMKGVTHDLHPQDMRDVAAFVQTMGAL